MRRAVILFIPVLLMLVAGELRAAPDIWQDLPALPGIAGKSTSSIRYLQADDQALRSALTNVPHENSGDRSHQIPLPMPGGGNALFIVVESPIMAPGLAAKYPEIKTFRVYGIDDEHAAGRLDITPLGFHGLIETSQGSVYINPRDFRAQDDVYSSRYKASSPATNFQCGVHDSHRDLVEELAPRFRTANRVQGNFIQYRLAVAATIEYHAFFGSLSANTTAAIASTINQVNLIYQRDFGITLSLVANNDEIYEVVDNGQLSNGDSGELLIEVNPWIDSNLTGGDTAYDIGHIFNITAFSESGIAYLGTVCDDNFKGGGVSGSPNPAIGPRFDIDLVAHEIGHQFNADHSFNGSTGSCLSNRYGATAYEPGSGSTIMAYASLCAAEDLQSTSEATFHGGSVEAVNDFTTTGSGSTCYTLAPTAPNTGNSDPVVVAIADNVIPANTAFILNGNATDIDVDTLSYQWDQMDTGCPTDSVSFGTDNGSNPLFRSYVPRGQSWRNFPALGTQLEGRFDKSEVLPCQNRDLDFRLTARDGNSGQDFENTRVTVDNTAGPFVVTNLDPDPGTIFAGTPFQVTWDPAGTDLLPINCMNVDIDLLTFNAAHDSYSIQSLATSVSNTAGSAMVTITPADATHPRARVRVKCSDNVFYDLSDTDLNVVQSVNPPVALTDTDFLAYSYANLLIAGTTAPVCGPVFATCSGPVVPPPPSGGGNGDASAFGYSWMLLLAGLSLFRHRRLLFRAGSAS